MRKQMTAQQFFDKLKVGALFGDSWGNLFMILAIKEKDSTGFIKYVSIDFYHFNRNEIMKAWETDSHHFAVYQHFVEDAET